MKLNEALKVAIQDAGFKENLAKLGATPVSLDKAPYNQKQWGAYVGVKTEWWIF